MQVSTAQSLSQWHWWPSAISRCCKACLGNLASRECWTISASSCWAPVARNGSTGSAVAVFPGECYQGGFGCGEWVEGGVRAEEGEKQARMGAGIATCPPPPHECPGKSLLALQLLNSGVEPSWPIDSAAVLLSRLCSHTPEETLAVSLVAAILALLLLQVPLRLGSGYP